MPSPRRSKLTAGSAQRAGRVAGAGDGAAQPAVAGDRGRRAPAGRLCRSIARSRSPAPSGTRALRAGREAGAGADAARRGSAGRRRSWPVASSATGGRPALRVIAEAMPAACEVEAHVGRGARAGDPRGAVDRAGEPEVGADGVGERQRQVADREVDVEGARPSGPGRSGCRRAEVERRAASARSRRRAW